jgi:3-isopropylmalate/(R)-2-methylmalate dehydratase small subunit
MMNAGPTASGLHHLAGTGIAVPGNDIDTDRIMPARFLKAITFAGLEKHVFADERRALKDRGVLHPFDDPRYQGASLLLVNRNFGCGSSREHAPQGLRRWGIRAVIGESFGEIFSGNCLAVGVPCLRVAEGVARQLQDAAISDGRRRFEVDLERKTLHSGDILTAVALPDEVRARLLEGTWDDLSVLLSAGGDIERTASYLPYLNGWRFDQR